MFQRLATLFTTEGKTPTCSSHPHTNESFRPTSIPEAGHGHKDQGEEQNSAEERGRDDDRRRDGEDHGVRDEAVHHARHSHADERVCRDDIVAGTCRKLRGVCRKGYAMLVPLTTLTKVQERSSIELHRRTNGQEN